MKDSVIILLLKKLCWNRFVLLIYFKNKRQCRRTETHISEHVAIFLNM